MLNCDLSRYKIALITEQLDQKGGGSRFIESIYKNVTPHATIFTPFINKELFPEFKDVRVSFLQSWIFNKTVLKHARFFLFPFAYESFRFDGYDIVITIGYGATRGVISGIDQPQISIVYSPSRYQWDKTRSVKRSGLKVIRKLTEWYLSSSYKLWAVTSIKRSDYIYSNSKYISKKIKKIFRVDSEPIYPGVGQFFFQKPFSKASLKKILLQQYNLILPEKYFYIVSRLYDYKKVDLAIKACNKLHKHLIIAGVGPDEKYLKKIADSRYIHFLGFVSDELNRSLFANAEAFLFPGYEDFGYTPVESMATGTPVVFYNKGGVTETVLAPKCGQAFNTFEEFIDILEHFDKKRYKKEDLIKRAKVFSEEQSLQSFCQAVNKAIKDFNMV